MFSPSFLEITLFYHFLYLIQIESKQIVSWKLELKRLHIKAIFAILI
ncbi:hypothetical protein HMPREF9088_1043 [Enterococcus italicus DSM 15952]|uniref:Uncharacterized protein n=1 Tax=Enterococcus italicus (strain DSM 15952 / CCUG 50447 / LMG 22039 / TP 1.5) TaxID=888064 RepID=E6LFA3_ENTI1|nr:hypothetical protein HMPREF9088_1043 [Enterococcus italicus DSM 15952]